MEITNTITADLISNDIDDDDEITLHHPGSIKQKKFTIVEDRPFKINNGNIIHVKEKINIKPPVIVKIDRNSLQSPMIQNDRLVTINETSNKISNSLYHLDSPLLSPDDPNRVNSSNKFNFKIDIDSIHKKQQEKEQEKKN